MEAAIAASIMDSKKDRILMKEAKRKSRQETETLAADKLSRLLSEEKYDAVSLALMDMEPKQNFEFISSILATPDEQIPALASWILDEPEQEDTGMPHNPPEAQALGSPPNPSELPDSPIHEIGDSVPARPHPTVPELDSTPIFTQPSSPPPPYSPGQYRRPGNS